MRSGSPARRRRIHGAAAVEFALVTALLCVLLLGGVEVGRLLWTWNAAVEATRLGARLAIVCEGSDEGIRERMRRLLPALQASQILIDRRGANDQAAGCDPEDCQSVRVALGGVTHRTWIPFLSLAVPMPAMQTALRKEFMTPSDNEVCP